MLAHAFVLFFVDCNRYKRIEMKKNCLLRRKHSRAFTLWSSFLARIKSVKNVDKNENKRKIYFGCKHPDWLISFWIASNWLNQLYAVFTIKKRFNQMIIGRPQCNGIWLWKSIYLMIACFVSYFGCFRWSILSKRLFLCSSWPFTRLEFVKLNTRWSLITNLFSFSFVVWSLYGFLFRFIRSFG